MSAFVLIILLLLNGVVSWWNAKVCGAHWSESKALGGFPRVLMWCGAIQSAIGFSMLLLVAGITAGLASGHLPAKAASAAMSLWYLAVIVPCIGTGLIITVQSWVVAYRERSWANMGVAAYNTFASGMNIYQAADGGVSDALSKVGDLFSSGDSKEAAAIKLVLLLVVGSLIGGALLTAWLIRVYDRRAYLAIAQERRAHA